MLLRDLMEDKLAPEKSRIMDYIVQLEEHLCHLEVTCFFPKDVTSGMSDDWRKGILFVESLLDKLGLYALVPGIQDFIDMVDEEIRKLGGRFMRLFKRKFMDTKEAMEKFSRSRSTIYRWIKKGKVKAKKDGRFWKILLQ